MASTTIPSPNSFLKQYLAITKKEFKIQLRYPVSFLSSFVMMFIIILVFTFVAKLFLDPSNQSDGGMGAKNLSTYMFWGFLSFNFFSEMLYALGSSLRQEQQTGTLESLFLFPLNHLANLLAKISWVTFINVFVGIFAFFVFEVVTGSVILNQLFLSIFIFALFLLQVFGISFMFGGISIRLRESIEPLIGMSQFILMIICSFFFPFAVLGPVVIFSLLFPISYTIDILRSTIFESTPELAMIVSQYISIELSTLVGLQWVLVIVSSILLPIIGYKYFLNQINKGRISGDLSDY